MADPEPSPLDTPPSPPPTCAVTVFGPERFTRTEGPPDDFTRTVSVPAWVASPYLLRIQNGEASGANRVSSARVDVNGVEVVSPTDLNQNVPSLSRPVSLIPQTTLHVHLDGAPRSYLTIDLCGDGADHTPPEVSVASPAPGGTIADATPALVVRYRDLVGAGEPGASGVDTGSLRVWLDDVERTSLFTREAGEARAELPASLALTDGSHVLRATVSDVAGNEGAGTGNFVVDTRPPQVVIVSPTRGEYASGASIVVSGGVVDASAVTVTVNGVAAALDANGAFSATVPLGDSPEVTLRAEARDAAGNVGFDEVTVRIDRVPPTIAITAPPEGAYVTGPGVDVAGTVADASPVVVDVNGEPAEVAGSPSGNVPRPFTARVPAPDGPLALKARARDAAGNTAVAERSVTVDSVAPVITIAEPAAGSITRAESVRLAGTVADASPVTLRLGETTVPVSDGAFAVDVPMASEGPITLTLTATDAVGHTDEASVSLVVDRTSPDLTIVAPTANAVLGAVPVVVQGLVLDATAVTVTVDGQLAERTGSAWQVSFDTLPEGSHSFTVAAEDQAGNRTSLTRDVALDLSPPQITITAPTSGSLTRLGQATVTGTVEDATAVTVVVSSGAGSVTAVVQGASPSYTFTAPGVGLAEGDNEITAVATDAAGRAGEARSMVTRDSQPPAIELTAPATISRAGSGQAVATVTDNLAVAEVTLTLSCPTPTPPDCTPATQTFAAPPYVLALTIPEGAASGDTLTLTAEARDTAGNIATATRGVKVAADGVVVGQVLSDTTGLPLAGAVVTVLGGGTVPPVPTDERGRYTLPASDARLILRAEKDGMTAVERDVPIASGTGTVPVDARLTPLAPPQTIADGAALVAGSVSVSATAGTYRLTVLSPQGLPGLLPLGWSPLVAFDLRAEAPASNLSATVTGLPTATVHLTIYEPGLHAWAMVSPNLTPSSGTVTASLPSLGTYALVAADSVEPPITIPDPGQVLPGLAMVSLPDTATSTGQVTPPSIPPTGGTAVGTLAVQSPVPLPSGTVVQAEVTETFTLESGQTASEEKRLEDILLYRTPAPEGAALAASLPIAASRTYEAAEVSEGKVHLDILAGRESVRGQIGGNAPIILDEGEARLSVPAGALGQDTAVDLEVSALSSFLPSSSGLVPLAELVIDFSGQSLSLPAELSVSASGLTPKDTHVIARVERVDGIPKLIVVAMAEIVGERLVSRTYPGLSGITVGGRYVFYRTPPIGFLTGLTTANGAPVRAVVRTDSLPFIGLAGVDGRYIVAAAVGATTATAEVTHTQLRGSGSAEVPAPAAVNVPRTVTLDIPLTGTVTSAVVTPADGAVAVDPNIQIDITTTTPLDPATVTTTNVRLVKIQPNPSGPPTETSVNLRLVLSGSGKALAAIPGTRLAFATRYRLEATGLSDTFGGAVTVPSTSFTTKADIPPVYDLKKIVFSFPDEDGNVTVSAPPGTLPPGTQILVVNTGNGVVASFVAENDGAVGRLVPTTFPATINDRLLVTITDPLGNVVTFERSQYVDPATGRTAIGAGGGTVEANDGSGVGLRIPEGAVDRGVTLQIEGLTAEELESLFPGQQPQLEGAHVGSALKITSGDKPKFKKEVDLVFPLPAGLDGGDACTAGGALPCARDAFYYVYRRIQLPPAPDGTPRAAFETIDQANVECANGQATCAPDDKRIVTASYPYSGYTDSSGLLDPSQGIQRTAENILSLMWTYGEPGTPVAGVVTGKVLRTAWASGDVPTYEPVAGALVSGVDEAGHPLYSGGNNATIAVSQADGTYTLWDDRYAGGTITVAASSGGETRTATAYEASREDWNDTLLRLFRNIATANITFAAVPPPPPPPQIQIVAMVVDAAGARNLAGNLILAETPLLLGFKAANAELRGVRVGSQELAFRVDPLRGQQPFGMDFLADYTPAEAGTFTVTATAAQPFGPPIVVSANFRVIAPGGGNDQSVPGAPFVLESETFPADGAQVVATTVFPRVVFSEPVRNLVGAGGERHVRLIEVATGQPVEIALSGVGPGAAGPVIVEEITSPDAIVTSLTIRPRVPLKYATRYRLVLNGSGDGIEDLPPADPPGSPPEKLIDNQAEFTTFGPQALTPPGTGETFGSPGIVVLGTRAFLLANYFTYGQIRVFDVSNPLFPEELTSASAIVSGRPIDLAGEGDTLVVATGPMAQPRPSNLLVFDVSNPAETRWVGAASVASSLMEGFVSRVTVRDGMAYVATNSAVTGSFKKSIQVVDLGLARQNFDEATGGSLSSIGYWKMLVSLNTDGQGFGQSAVVMTIEVPGEGRPAWLTDIDAGDFLLDGQSQVLVGAAGDIGLVVASPQSGQRLAQLHPQSEDGVYRLERGTALSLGPVAGRQAAVVVGSGLFTQPPDPAAPVFLLAVVDLTDPRRPVPLGFVTLPELPRDVVLKGDLALVGGTSVTYLVGLDDPSRPQLLGQIAGIGGRLALGGDGELLFATAALPLGGSSPEGGVRSANLSPGGSACPLLSLVTPQVTLEMVADPVNGALCGSDGRLVFGLCRATRTSLTVDGQPVSVSVDGAPPAALTNLDLPAGPHVIALPSGTVGTVSARKPFALRALDLADARIVEEGRGEVIADLKNRSVLPLAHTLVKGVDVFDGHVVRQATDIKLPGRHLGLEVTRTYSSAGRSGDGEMGAGWSFNYASSLFPTSCGQYVVVTPDGSSQTFRSTDGGQTFTPQKGYHTRLVRGPGDSYDFFDKAGNRHHFAAPVDPSDPGGVMRLDSIEEPHGDRIQVSYSGAGRVTQIAEVQPDGGAVRSLSLTYRSVMGADRITSIGGPTGLLVQYEYDAEGNLLSARRSGANEGTQPVAAPRIERYRYSASDGRDRHQLLEAIDPNGSRTEYVYYAQGDAFPGEGSTLAGQMAFGKQEYVKEVREFPSESETLTTSFAYDYSQASSQTFQNVVTDARSNGTRYVMNGFGGVVRIEEPLGKTTLVQWATNDILKARDTDGNGRVTDYGYDERGNLTSERITTSDFGVVTTTYAYDPAFNKLTFKLDAEGRETRYVIDPQKGDLTQATDAEGNVTRYVYDDRGRLTSLTDPRGFVTTHRNHDNFGNARSVLDPLGKETVRTYDWRGRLLRETTAVGLHDTRWVYDGLDRVVTLTRLGDVSGRSDDEVTRTEYTPNGEVRAVTNALGARTEYALDGLNRVVGSSVTVSGQLLTTEARYDGNGNKVYEKDRRGVARQFTYDALNRLSRVEIVSGPGSGPMGQVAGYAYDLVGNKKSETNLAGLTTRFEHDGLYRVTRTTFPESSPAYTERATYDKAGNRLSSTDRNEHTTVFAYDGLNRLVRTTNPLGQVTTVTYADPEGSKVNKAEEHDETRGLRTSFANDRLNRETSRTVRLEGAGSNGEVYTTATRYVDGSLSAGNPTGESRVEVTDPRGKVVRRVRDSRDRVVEQTVDPSGLNLLTRTSWDGLGDKKRTTDPNGNVTTFEYDRLGRLVRTVDALNHETFASYDGEGLKLTETDRRGAVRNFTYDNLGRPRTATLTPSISGVAWSQETQYQDQARRRIEIDARGKQTVFELDGLDRVVKATDPLGHSVVTRWDGVVKRAETDKRGNTTLYDYDALDRLTKTADPAPFDSQTVETSYQDASNRRIEKDRRGTLKATQLDPLGRTLTVTDDFNPASGSGIVLETNAYDGNGNKTSARDADGHETRFTYDAANRLSARTDGFGSPAAATTTFAYDRNGNVTRERDARAAEAGLPFSVERTYDALNRLTTTTDAEGNVTGYGYDPEGNRTSLTEPEGQETSYAYDELGKLTSVTQPSPASGEPRPVTAYLYDPNRNLVRQTDANGHVVAMAYDDLNRLTSRTQDPGGLDLVTQHEYDESGNETKLTDPKGQTVTSTYDELNRVKTKAYAFAPGDPYRPWRHTTSIAHTYDPNSNLTKIDEQVASGTDPPETLATTRSYDPLDRLTSETTTLPDPPSGGPRTRTVGYTYFGSGTRKTVTDPAGSVTSYTYDGQNRLATATTAFGTPQGATTTYGYFPDDLLRTVSYPNGVVATHGYDKADRLLTLTNAKAGTTVSGYVYTYSPNGNRLSQVETNGGTTETTTYTYDGLNRLASVTYPTDGSFPNGRAVTYGYDAVGNRTRETERDSQGTLLSDKLGAFDNVNRLTALDDLVTPANSTTFTWDANGNQTSKNTPGVTTAYRYDIRDKLVEAQQGPSITGRFQYDAEGRRTKKIGEEGIRQYVYDQSSLFGEYDENGTQKAKYDYGSDRLISLFRTDEGRRFFSLDGLRSVTNLTDDTGSAVASYHLDAWGNFRFPTELDTSKNRFAFTGHIWDKETSLFFAKARFYDPKVGRFTTQDSFLGEINEPPSLHRFAYGRSNPLRFIDPTGHCTGEMSYANFQDCFTAALTGIVAPPANFVANWGSALLYNATESERFRARGEAFQAQKEAVDKALQSPAHLLTATVEGFTDTLSSISENINEGRGREATERFGGFLAQAPLIAEGGGALRITPRTALVTAEGSVIQAGGTMALRGGPGAAAGILLSGNAKGNDATTVQENTPSKADPSPTKQASIQGSPPPEPPTTGHASESGRMAPTAAPRLRDPKTGRFLSDPANPPSPYKFTDAQRRAAWKRLAEDPNSPLTDQQRQQITERGWRGPQQPNPRTGKIETMELSHEPTPLREGGMEVVPRWPEEHAAVDPHRHLKKQQ